MRKVLITVAMAAAAVVLAPVQASAVDVLPRLTSDKMAAILTARGAKDVAITKPEAGVEIVSMNDGNGSDDFILSGCATDGCEGVQMTLFFNKDAKFNLAVVNSFNSKYLNAQASLTPDGRVYLVRLYVATGGVTEENVKANIEVFMKSPELFVQHVLSQATASKESVVQPVAAANEPKVEAGTGAQSARLRELKLTDVLAAVSHGRGHSIP